MAMDNLKLAFLNALTKFARQRPGIDWREYGGDGAAYRSECRAVTRDLKDFRELLRAVELRDAVTGAALVECCARAFSGRLSCNVEGGRVAFDYCTGQYWPTEYRKAACAVLACALWMYWAADAADADAIRRTARRNLSRGVALRYFN
jgi:hypothetical protein